MINFNQKNKGFTLLEALVAISILMVAVVAPITIAQKGLSSASYSKNQMIASYLAQDAIEYIINKRDENVINKNSWLAGLELCLSNSGCGLDTVNPGGVGTISADENLYLDRVNKFYGSNSSSGDLTSFTRKINIEEDPNGTNEDEALITVTVGWGTDNVEVKTLIYNY
jgi:type II secretory pathway pseudopilin PulG